ncbi:MAG: hypothetical protein NVSMB51_17570 [Solirubrobacteraceae bacterium]
MSAQRGAALSELADAFRGVQAQARRLRGRESQRADGGELTHAHFELLAALEQLGPLPAGELARAAELAAPTVTGLLDHLEHAGRIERCRSVRDRRIVEVRLTDAGAACVAAKRAAWQAHWERALEPCSTSELRSAAAVLHRLRTMLSEAADT